MIYEIAYYLKMSIKDILSMDYTEFLGWLNFFEQRPIGWKEDLRTYYIMQTSGMSELKKKPEEIFPSLRAIFSFKENMNPLDSLKESALFYYMTKAKGGIALDL